MPTGYTAELMAKGQSFEGFVMCCARAFGALVPMRDEPMNAPIRDFQPSDYYVKSLGNHRAELSRLERMPEAKQLAFGEKRKAEVIKRHEDWLLKERAENERLDEMKIEVSKWAPPSADHIELKKFMLSQIELSRHNLTYIADELAAAKAKTRQTYYAEAVAREAGGIAYCTEEQAKEITRTNERNEWVRQLRQSLQQQAEVSG